MRPEIAADYGYCPGRDCWYHRLPIDLSRVSDQDRDGVDRFNSNRTGRSRCVIGALPGAKSPAVLRLADPATNKHK